MFEDSLIESGNRFKTKRRLSTTIFSFFVAGYAHRGPDSDSSDLYRRAAEDAMMTFLVAPPPPPHRRRRQQQLPIKVVKMVSEVVNGELRTPDEDSKQSSDDQGRRSAAGPGRGRSPGRCIGPR